MTTAAIDRLVEIYENEVGPQLGAKGSGQGMEGPRFKQRLLADATKACAEFGIGGLQARTWWWLENTARRAQRHRLHAVLVLSWPVLGLPPNWYKERALPRAHRQGTAQSAARGLRLRPGPTR